METITYFCEKAMVPECHILGFVLIFFYLGLRSNWDRAAYQLSVLMSNSTVHNYEISFPKIPFSQSYIVWQVLYV